MSTQKKAMSTHWFSLELDGVDVSEQPYIDALFEVGCDDGLFGWSGKVQRVSFSREARSFPEAVYSAIHDIEKTVPEVRVVRVEREGLVFASDIAERTGRTPQSISLLIKGQRGPGNFPRSLHEDGRVWDWSDVVRWFKDALGEEVDSQEEVDFIAAANAELEARRRRARLRPAARQLVAKLAA